MSKHSTKGGRSVRFAAPKVHLDEAGPALTSQGGLVPVIQFLSHLGFRALFRQQVSHERSANAVYSLVDGALLVMIGLIGGARSLSQCVALWSDQVLQRLAGWPRVPDETTLGRLFKEVRDRHVSELETLNHVLRQRVWARAAQTGRSRIGVLTQKWIDADSTVKTVYGRQEGAAKGYNPHKRGALSYHPPVGLLHRDQGDRPGLAAHRQRLHQQWHRRLHGTGVCPVSGASTLGAAR